MASVRGAGGICGVKIQTDYIKRGTGVPYFKWGWLGVMPYGQSVDLDRLYGHKPMAGPKDALGNRSCYHLHYTGQARYTPEAYSTNTRVQSTQRSCWIYNKSNPSRKLLTISASESACGGEPASLCGGTLQYRATVGSGKDQWPGLWPRYCIQSLKVEASCVVGKTVDFTIEARLKSNHQSVYPEYSPEVGTASGSCTLEADRSSRSQLVTLRLQWTDVEGAVGTVNFTVMCTVSNTLVVGQTDPKLEWLKSRGFFRDLWTLPSLILAHDRFRDEKLPDLAVSGMDHLQEVTINSLAYTRDLTRLRGDAQKLIKTLKKVKNPKSWPDLWLSYRYGFRLFVNDTKEIIDAAKQYRKRKAFKGSIRRTHSRSSGSTVNPFGDRIDQRIGLTIYSDEKSLSERDAIHAASSLDLLPSLNNVWDFVPYSFVVDWIIPVGDYLERLDTAAAIWKYPIRSAVVTVRSDLEVTLPPNWGGAINYTLFTRSRYSQAQLSRRAAQLPSGMLSGLSLKHGIDTLCLAVQRFKR